MNKRTKELRKLLAGSVYQDQETGLVLPAPNVLYSMGNDYHRGADSLRFFGMKSVYYQYRVHGDLNEGQMAAVRALLQFGFQCLLPSTPDTLVVMQRSMLLNPVAFTLDAYEDMLLLGIHTPRSPLCLYNLRSQLTRWAEMKPLALVPVEDTLSRSLKEAESPKKEE